MTKVVYNACFGGFSLSLKAAERLEQLGIEVDKTQYFGSIFLPKNIERHNPILVQVVEELKDKASGKFSKLKIREIKGKKYIISEYDGNESVETPEDIDWIKVK